MAEATATSIPTEVPATTGEEASPFEISKEERKME